MASKLKREFIELLEKDKEFRYSIAGLIGYSEVLEEIKKLREDFSKRFEEHDRKFESILERLEKHDERFESINEEIKKLREDFSKRFEEHDRKFESIWVEIKSLKRSIEEFEKIQKSFNEVLKKRLDALGARWGLMSEEAFREGMKSLLKEQFGWKVEKWTYNDKNGEIYGHPSIVDVDLVLRNGKHILIEIKSHVGKADVAIFLKKANLYKKVRGVEPEMIIITPYIDESARRLAESLNISIYTTN